MDDVFSALAHPARRELLDQLRERDGQTLSELQQGRSTTRFAVMKHLKLLEAAHLVVSHKVGRERFHYLNPLPIQLLAERWISQYAAPFTRTMSILKSTLEERTTSMTSQGPKHVYEMFVRAAPQAVWDILTDDAKTPLWQHFDMASRTEWREGGSITFLVGDKDMIVGKIVELTPPARLVHSFSAQWSAEVTGDPPSRVTWDISPIGDGACKITLTHDDFGGDTATSRTVTGGWPEVLSRLKTLVETGTPFRMAPPAAA